MAENLKPEALRVDGKYNWRNQPERLTYIGPAWYAGDLRRWHQFSKVDEPGKVWCEVLDADLASFEETAPEGSMTDTTKGAALPAAAEQLASPTAAAALYALDDLEGAARGDQPFPYFAAPVIRQFIEASIGHPPAAAPPVWIQPDHLAKARSAPFLCRVEPTQRGNKATLTEQT